MKRNAVSRTDLQKDPRWLAIIERDPAADGQFFYSVKTTGVYCRPSCGARLPRPENVAFHSSAEAAEAAGFRPCKRCRPHSADGMNREGEIVESACRLMETSGEPPSLQEVAAAVGLSPFYFHRLFRRVTGLTPREWAAGHRAERLRRELPRSQSVTEAIYTAGYNSNSRFYQESAQILGMPPAAYQRGAADIPIRFAIGECTLGAILVAATERGLCAIFLGDDPNQLARDLQDRFPKAALVPGDRRFERTVAHVVGFVEAPQTGLQLPLDLQGTAFQQRVWQALCEIPPGTTLTYTEIARRIGQPGAVRAVASACAGNTLAVAIPCHRVIRTDGTLSGYRWGVDRKRALLAREAIQKRQSVRSVKKLKPNLRGQSSTGLAAR